MWRSQVRSKSVKSFFDFPEVYDQTMGNRPEDVQREVKSIHELLKRNDLNPARILELGCGTCNHSIALAKLGHRVSGLDLSKNALAYAKQKAEKAGVKIELHHNSFVDFDLGAQFDSAIFMYETFPLIATYDDLHSHFDAVSRHLRPGGLYIIDKDISKHGYGTEYSRWGEKTVPIEGGEVEIWQESLPGNWINGTTHMKYHSRIHLHEQTYETVDEWVSRNDNATMLRFMIDSLPGWELDGLYRRHDLGLDISNETHYFVVLKRE